MEVRHQPITWGSDTIPYHGGQTPDHTIEVRSHTKPYYGGETPHHTIEVRLFYLLLSPQFCGGKWATYVGMGYEVRQLGELCTVTWGYGQVFRGEIWS